MAGNWTESEIEAIVKDYFDMLRDEQRGLVFNKSEHRRALVARISRTPSAIERKHMNISAVMNSLGPSAHPWLPAVRSLPESPFRGSASVSSKGS